MLNHGQKTGSADVSAFPYRRARNQVRTRTCNLCSIAFKPKTPFDRYCADCRQGNELLRFSEWLPETEFTIQKRLSA